ncbi:pilus assembly protein CpaC [Selenomonas sp. GACV-9]|uniref:type II and III secretion system protein family protein n=1 Tax=Selenomonas sp. GACV-9 TaxID=3158782 RepID=UPI0008E0D35D|nr:pilus assembly protein CpaC [Selenomonas ruminantium]
MEQWKKSFTLGLAAVTAAVVAPAPAYAYVQPIWLGVNQSYYMNTGSSITRVAVANPKIADVKILGASALNVVAFNPGTTTLNIWTQNGMRQEYSITVSKEDKGLASIIQKAIDLPHVEVTMVGDRVLLKGRVKNQYEKELAFKIASLYVGDDAVANKNKVMKKVQSGIAGQGTDIEGEEDIDTSAKVVNLLEMINPDQINIEAMVLEINSNDAAKLGMEYSSPEGTTGEFYAGETYGAQRSKGSHWYTRNWLYTHFSQINARIHALITDGRARIISRPNITTMSGKTAGILVGGQIPVPVKSDNNVSVEYKPYGIQLNLIKPTVDNDGNITADIQAVVSRLDWTNAVTVNGFNMPGMITRQANTMVNIPTGMTMAIGGLLNSAENKAVNKVPLLGNIPVLGELFKYHNDSQQESEIMILITPRVVNEQTKAAMSKDMKKIFNDSRREVQKMEKVDVNGTVPPSEEELKAKNTTEAKEMAKQLLNKPSFAERYAALRKEMQAKKEISLDNILPPDQVQK